MKKLVLPAACAALLLQMTSCINTEREVGTSQNADKVYTPPTNTNRLSSRTVLNKVQTTHYFSNTKTKDNFILLLQGPKILNAQAKFIIVSSTGDTLRKEVMPASALLDERELEDPQAATVRDKEIAILKGMNNFFREDRFTQPAVPKTAAQPAEIDPQNWSAVKEDNKAVGFDYITVGGKERRIAYAKKLQKAVVIAE
ncbi:hypothetical protein [Hymenobacter cellulosivorans]|uniref:Uncharacterized protein n=1 Tax=Hymenobacter cellulosivorans TaxID=2932249 RepID=A0ABY4F5J4_9BACT|nr:hypothetical protein [Hymenobacter cellulosivorans]UOQ51481.1 hypothetical protein MUN80_17140 [Hymenobacter cellulosivorans]